MKKLKLKWVAETIGDSYKKWRKGDEILLQAQTGTGKTYFIKNTLIPYMKPTERMLIVCNRKHLKQQIKKDLLSKLNEEQLLYLCKKYDVKDIDSVTYQELEKITTINNVTIISYHTLQYKLADAEYNLGEDFNISNYKYIVLDEVHFLLSDASFNNSCRFASEKLLEWEHNSIKIFISATLENISRMIKSDKRNENFFGKHDVIEYTTGIDYSYINPNIVKYLKVKDMYNLISNDKTDDKWLVFVSNKSDGKELQEKLGDKSIFIQAGDKNSTVDSIINNSKFQEKVLITTKVLDNGVNLSDNKLKNIIIHSYDRVTFIQELGRIRVDINDPQEINLFIPMKSKKAFTTLKEKAYERHTKSLELYNKNYIEFARKYDLDFNELPQELFYKERKTGKWMINKNGYANYITTMAFINQMIEQFETNDKFAFANEQLKWIGLSFANSNVIEKVESEDDKMELYLYIKSLVGKRLYKEDQKELIDKINYRVDGKQRKSIAQLNKKLEIDEMPFEIVTKRIDTKDFRGTVWILKDK